MKARNAIKTVPKVQNPPTMVIYQPRCFDGLSSLARVMSDDSTAPIPRPAKNLHAHITKADGAILDAIPLMAFKNNPVSNIFRRPNLSPPLQSHQSTYQQISM